MVFLDIFWRVFARIVSSEYALFIEKIDEIFFLKIK